MAEPGPPIDAIIDGTPRRVELICFVRTSHGLMARLCWREPIGDSDPEPHTVTLPEALLIELPGVDYGEVPVVDVQPQRSGRVATGRVWRTG